MDESFLASGSCWQNPWCSCLIAAPSNKSAQCHKAFTLPLRVSSLCFCVQISLFLYRHQSSDLGSTPTQYILSVSCPITLSKTSSIREMIMIYLHSVSDFHRNISECFTLMYEFESMSTLFIMFGNYLYKWHFTFYRPLTFQPTTSFWFKGPQLVMVEGRAPPPGLEDKLRHPPLSVQEHRPITRTGWTEALTLGTESLSSGAKLTGSEL